jgi:hypothetical protein
MKERRGPTDQSAVVGENPIGSGGTCWHDRDRKSTTMDAEDDLTSRILSALSDLPAEDQSEVILAVISAALKSMSLYRILEVRAEISCELAASVPLVAATLDLIDGQIALREIADEENWR